MFSPFGKTYSKTAAYLAAGAFLLLAAALVVLFFWSPRATLSITTGTAGSSAERLISSFIELTMADNPHIRFRAVPETDLTASAKALEEGKVDIAIVRSDVSPPSNGQTLMILRREAIFLVFPPRATMKNIAQLSGKTVAIPVGPVQADNSRALDVVLSFFNIAPATVKRLFVPVSEIGDALRDKRADVALGFGAVGPGEAVNVVASVTKAFGAPPKIAPIDDARAIARHFPGFETIEVPVGSFKASPPLPAEAMETLSVDLRFVVPASMLNAVGGVLARSLLKVRTKFMEATSGSNRIEAPDIDEKKPLMPIHPGVRAYLVTGDRSFLDEMQGYLYVVGIPLSLGASLIAMLGGLSRNRKLEADRERVYRLLVIAEEARNADAAELVALEGEFQALVARCVSGLVGAANNSEHVSVSLAIDHARRAIEAREASLRAAASSALSGDDAR